MEDIKIGNICVNVKSNDIANLDDARYIHRLEDRIEILEDRLASHDEVNVAIMDCLMSIRWAKGGVTYVPHDQLNDLKGFLGFDQD